MTTRLRIAWVIVLALLTVAFLDAPAAEARKRKKRRKPPAVAGVFDYYVLSLSWSPQHCAGEGEGDPLQCDGPRRFAFIVHGLWPQFERGYPQSCSTQKLPDDVRDNVLDIMPSEKLVEHEWKKHGTCSGLAPDAYFALARRSFGDIVIPDRYQDPPVAFRTDLETLETDFIGANAALTAAAIAVQCQGKFLQEVRICLDRDLQVRNCGSDVDDRCGASVTVRPVR